jgi:hypothetical protein
VHETIRTARLWSWQKAGPNQFVDINCRAREAGYKLHAVLPRVTFGLDGAPQVEVITAGAQQLLLPLDDEYMVGQFFVEEGTVPKGGHRLWPLEMLHDSGLVMVFVYELSVDSSGQIIVPFGKFQPSGAGNWQPVRPAEKELLAEMAPAVPDKDAWLEVMTGPFMRKGGELAQTSATTYDDKTTSVLQPRIVVAISLATCRERADFEPGGLVGMAKIFPNIMVCSSIWLSSLRATVKIERTPSTTALDSGNGKSMGTCCNAYSEVGAMLVADANESGMQIDGPGPLDLPTQMPFWGGTFAYVKPEAHMSYTGQRLKVVDRSKTETRTYPGGTRRLVLGSRELTSVKKEPGQGEWDNLHLAPALYLDLASMVRIAPPKLGDRGGSITSEYANDPATTHTDKVWMAPFCSHDCFHTHWRWSAEVGAAEWTYGWDATGPYKKAGAPMVPLHQDVELELHGPSSYSYHAQSTYGGAHLPGTWDIVMHHGAAYAQSIVSWLKFWGAQINVTFQQGVTSFYDSKGTQLTVGHAPLMYWLLRYEVDKQGGDDGEIGQIIVRDRIQFSQEEIDGARKT